ncbi:class I SAM-dependent methyltransferase [Mycolicibacterium sphagni]|uniref:class I SAM-dependent methyltransferase n=1 Tax=Mycolicibacterium sphagni TaxID=1786 RepID=UPI0021F2560C|nr:class I SAM-dependent methyltransferase [Mycolicibacterium sphagni]
MPATDSVTVVDIGSQDVNGSLREVTPSHFKYIGIDMVAGKGVDIVLDDPYKLPLDSESVDIVICSSCFEHSEMFWLLFLEVMRILKPAGLFYINVPSNGAFHRYPVDCWRFYPDSGNALVTWARRNGMNSALLESYTSGRDANRWNDFIAIFLKDEAHADLYKDRVTSTFYDFDNAIAYGNPYIVNFGVFPKRIVGRIFRRISSGLANRNFKISRRGSADEVRV